jgi:selenocysteine-specific elongation factor
MRSLILGTAGHIDHGKTELVRALTGVDTDRLKEEKERGITIDLGFAELPGSDVRLGVIDVPGHEGFVRNMLAGATGMDVVLLVVAADEGVMPQTREHLAIVRLLAVQRLVVALTKVDLVEPEWLSLVRDEVAETLDATPYAGAPVVATSARTGQGIESLRTLLLEQGASAEGGDPLDLTALPIDRAFSVRGTGTVVTGTLWSGRLRVGERVRLLPEGLQGRVRGLQVHGAEVDEAHAGARTAVALTGEGIDLDHVRRGQTLVTDAGWPASQMLTVRFSLLGDTDWELAHNQRVRVHLGTAEVMARCVLWEPRPLSPGAVAWGQLRLEEPVAARARQRIVLRSYSPVQTIGGAEVVEPLPPKRRGADTTLEATFRATLEGDAVAAVESVAARAGWAGTPAALLAVTTGLAPEAVESAVGSLEGAGAVRTPQGRLVPADLADETRRLLLDRVDRTHAAEPFRPGTPVDVLRDALAEDAAEGLADTVLTALVAERVLVSDRGVVARTGFEPTLTSEQQALEERLARHYRDADLQPPTVPDLPEPIRADPAFWALVRRLEESGRLVSLDEGLFVWGEALDRARRAVREQLGGREGLGPADFRDAVPVSRRHLLPILAHFDRTGVTVRTDDGRAVLP